MAAWYDARVNLTGRGEPIEIVADRATTNFFALLGTPPMVGRTFTTGSDLSRVEPEVVLSEGLWRRRYGSDPAVIGQPITLNGESFTIVGVMRKGFAIRTTELAESRAELWIATPLVATTPNGMGGPMRTLKLSVRGTMLARSTDAGAGAAGGCDCVPGVAGVVAGADSPPSESWM